MRNKLTIKRCVSLVVMVFTCCLWFTSCSSVRTHHDPVPRQFEDRELAGSWIGFTDRDASWYKLVLKTEGRGLLFSRFEQGLIATNMISKWSINSQGLFCEFQHDGAATSPLSLRCDIRSNLLVAHLVGVGGWTELIMFRRSQFIEDALFGWKSIPEHTD
jgi:hypothetical protein